MLKTLRQKRGLTAEELAEKANVTRATIVKMETGFDNPTVQTIEALARVFQLTSSELLRLSEGVRLEKARVEDFTRPGYGGKRIVFDNLEIYYLTARKGVLIESEYNLHEDTTEICFVMSGCLQVSVGDQDMMLEAGTAVRFNALHEHRIKVREETAFLIVHHNVV